MITEFSPAPWTVWWRSTLKSWAGDCTIRLMENYPCFSELTGWIYWKEWMFSQFWFLFLLGFLAPEARIFWEQNRLCLAAAPMWSPGDFARWSVFHNCQSSDADGAWEAESCTPERARNCMSGAQGKGFVPFKKTWMMTEMLLVAFSLLLKEKKNFFNTIRWHLAHDLLWKSSLSPRDSRDRFPGHWLSRQLHSQSVLCGLAERVSQILSQNLQRPKEWAPCSPDKISSFSC